jgi:hypothetical protein
MHVDRQKYLALVSVIAAGGASGGGQNEEPPVAPPVVVAEPEPPPVVNEELVVVAEPQPEAQPPAPRPLPPGPTNEAVLAPPQPFSSGGMCRAKGAAANPKGCNDMAGPPAACAPPPGSIGFVRSKCNSYRKHFKPRVAQRAVACVNGQRVNQSRDGCETYRCGDQALKQACLDPSAQSLCRTVAQQCGTSLGACTSMLSGMNALGRQEVAACAAKGCQFGLWSCIEGM